MTALNVKVSSDDLPEAWDDLAARDPAGSVYHTRAWHRVLVKSYGYRPFHLLLNDSDGNLAGGLPLLQVESRLTGNRLISLPFSNACGPIGDPRGGSLLLEEAIRLSEELDCQALEVRVLGSGTPFEGLRFQRVDSFLTSIVTLDPDPDVVWRRFKDKNLRTEVRQARKKGLAERKGETLQDLRTFYRLLLLTKRKHGVPAQPFHFFRNLWEEFAPAGNLQLFLAEHSGHPVSGLITLRFGAKQYAAYMGTDPKRFSLRPNQLLFWTAMEWGCRTGCRSFDFLRTDAADGKLRYFKGRWRAQELDLPYFYYPEIKGTAATVESSLKYKLITGLLKRMPASAGGLFGRLFYRHFG